MKQNALPIKKSLTSVEAYNCLVNQVPYLDLISSFSLPKRIVLSPREDHYFVSASYKNWITGFLNGQKSLDAFYSFLQMNALVFLSVPFEGKDKISSAYFAQESLFHLFTENPKPEKNDLHRVLVGAEACLETLLRHEANLNLPFSYRQFTFQEKEEIVEFFYGREDLSEEEKSGFKAILESLCLGNDPTPDIVYGTILFGEGVDEKTGVNRDSSQALKHFMSGYRKGDFLGLFMAGYVYYLNGLKDPKGPDYASAFRSFELGAEHGELEAYPLLADMYMNGKFVSQDYKEARFLLETDVEVPFKFALVNQVYYYLAPYAYYLGKLLIKEHSPEANEILFLLLLGRFSYVQRKKEDDFYYDRIIIKAIDALLPSLHQKLKLSSVPFALPYPLSDWEYGALSDRYFNFMAGVNKFRFHGIKGEESMILDLIRSREEAFPLPLLGADCVISVTDLRLEVKVDHPLFEDLDLLLDAKEMSQINVYPHFGFQLKNGSYKIDTATIKGFSHLDHLIHCPGDFVYLKKDQSGLKKGSKGIIKEVDPLGDRFLVEFTFGEALSWAVLELDKEQLAFHQ